MSSLLIGTAPYKISYLLFLLPQASSDDVVSQASQADVVFNSWSLATMDFSWAEILKHAKFQARHQHAACNKFSLLYFLLLLLFLLEDRKHCKIRERLPS